MLAIDVSESVADSETEALTVDVAEGEAPVDSEGVGVAESEELVLGELTIDNVGNGDGEAEAAAELLEDALDADVTDAEAPVESDGVGEGVFDGADALTLGSA